MKWIVDTDYSSNSQKALEILFANKLDIVAITVVFGLEKQSPYDIKRKIESDLQSKFNITGIPVYSGATEPYVDYTEELGDDEIENPYHVNHKQYNIPKSKDGLKDINIDEVAAVKITELINLHQKNLRILTLSALTNLSLAILLDNSIKDKFDKLIVIGGSTTGKGNSGVFAEANFRADPVASKNVVIYYKNVLVLPMEIELNFLKTTLNKEITLDDFGFAKDYVKSILSNKRSILHILGCLYIINEKLGTKLSKLPSDVDIIGKYTRGALTIEKYPWLNSNTFNEIELIEEFDSNELKNTLKLLH